MHEDDLTDEALRQSLLFGLAKEMGQEMAQHARPGAPAIGPADAGRLKGEEFRNRIGAARSSWRR